MFCFFMYVYADCKKKSEYFKQLGISQNGILFTTLLLYINFQTLAPSIRKSNYQSLSDKRFKMTTAS